MIKNHSRPSRARAEPRLEQMNLNLLLALHWLLVERSVTRAAVRLGVTQSTMSPEPRPTPECVLRERPKNRRRRFQSGAGSSFALANRKWSFVHRASALGRVIAAILFHHSSSTVRVVEANPVAEGSEIALISALGRQFQVGVDAEEIFYPSPEN